MIDKLLIRPPRPEERPAICGVLASAFRRDAEFILVQALWRDGAFKIELVAESDGTVIGYCGFSAVTADPILNGLLLGLAPLAVANDHQCRGVGKALAMRGLELCKQHAAALVVVLGEPEYYSRFGFKPASDYNVKWAAMDAGRAFQLIDFDSVAGGEAHSINYHAAFSEV